MLVPVVIPAFDEEGYLGPTLDSLNRARALPAWRGRYKEVPR